MICQFVKGSAELERAKGPGVKAVNKTTTKMKRIVKSLIMHCNSISKRLNWRKHWLFPVTFPQWDGIYGRSSRLQIWIVSLPRKP